MLRPYVYRPATRTSELLQQQEEEIQRLRARQTPVPVSERPWERKGWCNEHGRCWWTAGEWTLLEMPYISWWLVNYPQDSTSGFMLPAHALPIPQQEENQ